MTAQASFGLLPPAFTRRDTSEIVLLPVPYDETSTWQKGADRGPTALLEAAVSIEYYDLETSSEVYRRGIFVEAPILEASSPEAMVGAVREAVGGHLGRKKFVVTLGGEHSVSVGAIHAHAQHVEGLTVLQLDAHADLREEYRGSRFNHACVMARVREVCPIVQVGIRSAEATEAQVMTEHPVFFARDITGPSDDWMAAALASLGRRVYVTIDLDVFDPAIMPATGTPEPGGLQWYPVLRFLRRLARERELVGFDIVELCPNPAHKAADVLAAKLLYTLLSYRFAGLRS